MKTLKESILDKDWDYDTLDPKTPFENALIDYFDTVKKDSKEGRLLYVNSTARLADSIYNLANQHLKKISRATAMRKNKCALRAVVVNYDSKDQALQISFDNNPDNEYIDMSMASIYQTNAKLHFFAVHGQRIECFAIEPHTFELLKCLIDNL